MYLKYRYLKNVGKDMEKRGPSYMIGGIVNWCSHCRKEYTCSQKTENRTTTWHSSITLKKKLRIWKDACTLVFIPALFTVAKLKKMWWNITQTPPKIKFYPFAATWMDLEDIMLNEISQIEKDKYCMISLICRI